MHLSYEDELPWILKEIISIKDDFIEFFGLDVKMKEEISVCFYLTKKKELINELNNHY